MITNTAVLAHPGEFIKMKETFLKDEVVDIYCLGTHRWKPAKYLTYDDDGQRHIVKTMRGDTRHLTPGHIRKQPTEQKLAGWILVFKTSEGAQSISGPYKNDIAAKKAIDGWRGIYPEGPIAVIDLDQYNITFTTGDGVPDMTRKPHQPLSTVIQ